MGFFSKPIEKILGKAKEYSNLRIDELKLQIIKGLSLSLNGILAFMLIMMFAFAAIIGINVALVILLGNYIGYAPACLTMALIFLIITAVLFSKRKNLFTGSFVRMFVRVFFDNDESRHK